MCVYILTTRLDSFFLPMIYKTREITQEKEFLGFLVIQREDSYLEMGTMSREMFVRVVFVEDNTWLFCCFALSLGLKGDMQC